MPCPEKFNDTLIAYKVDQSIIDQINDGYEGIGGKTSKKIKAAYFKRAVEILEEQAGKDKMQEVFEANGCCTTGAREKASKAFAKAYGNCTLQEKLEKIKDVPNMGYPVLEKDGTITLYAVNYIKDGKHECACSNYNGVKRDYSVSKNYCYCCAGHFKYHYQIMLGSKLKTLEIVSSPLDSDGESQCVMRFQLCE